MSIETTLSPEQVQGIRDGWPDSENVRQLADSLEAYRAGYKHTADALSRCREQLAREREARERWEGKYSDLVEAANLVSLDLSETEGRVRALQEAACAYLAKPDLSTRYRLEALVGLPERCEKCGGAGDDPHRDGPCSKCQGTGLVGLPE